MEHIEEAVEAEGSVVPAEDAVEESAPVQEEVAVESEDEIALSDNEEVAEAAEVAAYEARLKYTFDGEEKDIDEFWRPLINSEDSEKRIIETLQMAEALPGQKEKYQALEGQYKELNQTFVDPMKKLSAAYQGDDLEKFFKILGVDDNKIRDYAVKKWQYDQLPPEEKKMYDDQRSLRDQNSQYEEELGRLREQEAERGVRELNFQIDQELGKADVTSAAQAYDGVYGSGAFQNLVFEIGRNDSLQKQTQGVRGQDMSAAEAVGHALQRAQPLVNRLGSQPATPEVSKPKVVPNVSAKSTSGAAGRQYASLDDLKKRASEFE